MLQRGWSRLCGSTSPSGCAQMEKFSNSAPWLQGCSEEKKEILLPCTPCGFEKLFLSGRAGGKTEWKIPNLYQTSNPWGSGSAQQMAQLLLDEVLGSWKFSGAGFHLHFSPNPPDPATSFDGIWLKCAQEQRWNINMGMAEISWTCLLIYLPQKASLEIMPDFLPQMSNNQKGSVGQWLPIFANTIPGFNICPHLFCISIFFFSDSANSVFFCFFLLLVSFLQLWNATGETS